MLITPIPTEIADRLPTPCLLIDLAAVDRNIKRAAALVGRGPVSLRPHFKAHKCTRLLRRQLDGGGCVGVACQTAAEALVLATAGFEDILLANIVIDPCSLRELAEAARVSRVTVVIDDPEHATLLGDTAGRGNVELGVLIELDVGLGRCGLPPNSDELIRLADLVPSSPGLRFVGIQAYEGHVVDRDDRTLRRTILTQIYGQLRIELSRLERAGYEGLVVSGGGTGTLDLAIESGVVTEVQAGSYVLMDATYAALDLPFKPALYLATRAISRRDPRAAVLNVGLKETSVEQGFPKPIDRQIAVLGLSDEHARVRVREGQPLKIGDFLLLIPSHVDPTTNLHDALFVWDGVGDLERWAIDGRRGTTAFA